MYQSCGSIARDKFLEQKVILATVRSQTCRLMPSEHLGNTKGHACVGWSTDFFFYYIYYTVTYSGVPFVQTAQSENSGACSPPLPAQKLVPCDTGAQGAHQEHP